MKFFLWKCSHNFFFWIPKLRRSNKKNYFVAFVYACKLPFLKSLSKNDLFVSCYFFNHYIDQKYTRIILIWFIRSLGLVLPHFLSVSCFRFCSPTKYESTRFRFLIKERSVEISIFKTEWTHLQNIILIVVAVHTK